MIDKSAIFVSNFRSEIKLLRTPISLEEEHGELMRTLRTAGNRQDKTGEAVRDLLGSLEPHFEKEERVAMPLLGVLPELVSGDKIENLRQIADSQEPLLHEYNSMFQEHKSLIPLIERATGEAAKENHSGTVETLEALVHHARVEEEVLYPAALLAGTLAKVLLRNEVQAVIR